MLVARGVFKKIKVNYMIVGHTHAQIDQVFSRLSVGMNYYDTETIDKLTKVLWLSYTYRGTKEALEKDIRKAKKVINEEDNANNDTKLQKQISDNSNGPGGVTYDPEDPLNGCSPEEIDQYQKTLPRLLTNKPVCITIDKCANFEQFALKYIDRNMFGKLINIL